MKYSYKDIKYLLEDYKDKYGSLGVGKGAGPHISEDLNKIDPANYCLIFETWVFEQNRFFHAIIFEELLENMPLYINNKEYGFFAEWRLKLGK